jgi:hypothetical protein
MTAEILVLNEDRFIPKARPSYGPKLTPQGLANIKTQMQTIWQERGCTNPKRPCYWVVSPLGKLTWY